MGFHVLKNLEFLFERYKNKPGIREKVSNEETDSEFIFA